MYRIIAYFLKNHYFCIMNKELILKNLSSAEKGDLIAQSILCRYFFDNKEIGKTLPDAFWKRVEALSLEGKDFANFIMHCRYFAESGQEKLSYEYIRKAVRHKDVPLAVLRLGLSYEQGIGVTKNLTLAMYFYETALSMKCQEAEGYIDHIYNSGEMDMIDLIETSMKNNAVLPPKKKERFKRWIERERMKKNYGRLSKLREFLPEFYPDYNKEEAFDDILNSRNTVNADICYSLCTTDNHTEFDLDILDHLLEQLYAPIISNKELHSTIVNAKNDYLLGSNEKELLQCIVNLRHSFTGLLKTNAIKEIKMPHLSYANMLPYFKPFFLTVLRRWAFRCILALQDLFPARIGQFLDNLNNDEALLNVAEETTEDVDLQLFLISFVELNIDTETIELEYQGLLSAYKNHQPQKLADQLNDFVGRLTFADIEHQLPVFSPDNLPQIDLTSERR